MSGSVAFSIEHHGKERLAIVAEMRRSLLGNNTGEVIEAIVASVSHDFEIQPGRVVLVRTGSIIKTSSGKTMRRANRDALLGGHFEVVADRVFEEHGIMPGDFVAGETPDIGQFMVAWASAWLNEGLPVDPDMSLTAYGLDSIRAVELSEEIKSIFGLEWPPYIFFDEISIARLAAGEGKAREDY